MRLSFPLRSVGSVAIAAPPCLGKASVSGGSPCAIQEGASPCRAAHRSRPALYGERPAPCRIRTESTGRSPVRWNRRRPVAAGGVSGAGSVSDGIGMLAGLLPVRPEPQPFRPDGGRGPQFPRRTKNERGVRIGRLVRFSFGSRLPGGYFSVPSSACRIMSSLAVMTISTRRFWARPSAVELSAMGAS